jgi:hypothetical protein
MWITPLIRQEAQDILLQLWRQLPAGNHATTTLAPVRDAASPCPVVWVLDDLLRLLAENHGRPVSEMRSSIRRLLLERAYMANVMAMGSLPPLEMQVDMTITLLEEVRQMAMSRGQWSDQQAAPQMCG